MPKTSAKTTAAKAREQAARARDRAAAARRKKKIVRAQVAGVVLIAVGLLSAVSLLLSGSVGKFLWSAFKGLFGSGGYLVPIFLIYIGFQTALHAFKKGCLWKNLSAFGFLFIASAYIHIFSEPAFHVFNIVTLYENVSWLSGGLIGGLATTAMLNLFQWPGTIIIYTALMICFVIVLSGITLDQIIDAFKSRKEAENGEEDEDEVLLAPPPKISDYVGKRKFQIDQPLDDVPVKADNSPSESELVFSKGKIAPVKLSEDKPKQVEKPIVSSLDIPIISKAEIAKEEHTIAQSIAVSDSETPPYTLPPVSLLSTDKRRGKEADSTAELQSTAQKIVDTLKSFGVETKITEIAKGPTVTRYELQPSAGVKISKITNLSDDIAMNLAAIGVRIEAPIPGKAAVGIEVPNKNVNTVFLRDIIESNDFAGAASDITFALGIDIAGDKICGDISKMPHMLIAGATGSGKSVCINSLIISLLYKSSPDRVKMIMIDPKVVELGVYNGIPHLSIPVVTNPKNAAGALSWAVGEMVRRYQDFAEKGVRDLTGFNQLAVGDDEITAKPRLVIIIDELADLMMAAPAEVEDAICRLAQMGRAAGIHLVIATQRPSVDVITGIIKANIPSRIAFAVSSQVDSRTILDMGGAEKLIGRGDMLYYPLGAVKPLRLQGCFISDKEVESVVSFIKKSGTAEYDNGILEHIEKEINEKSKAVSGAVEDGEDPLFNDAVEVVVEAGSASTSLLQRRLKLGYARAARIIDVMADRGIVGPYEGSKPRQVLISKDQYLEMMVNKANAD